ncbi:MAG: TonB-dependent receptor plug domain-containing protein [Chitinophagales bacterium]|nr:TonB-dependent receptor plug domain-containing protein [Chitinophagales bacterium]
MQKLITILICWSLGIPFVYAVSSDSTIFSSQTDTLFFDDAKNISLLETPTNAGDAIKSVPGVFLRSSTFGGVQTVAAQGLGSQYVQILWNDIPMNSGMLGVSDLSLFSVGYKQEVTYALQGQEFATGGLAGVVNIKDKNDLQDDISISLKQAVGSFGQSLTQVFHQGKKNNHRWSVSGSYERVKNNFKYNDYTIFPNATKTQRNGDYNKWYFYPKWSMNFKDGSSLEAFQEVLTSHRNIPPFLVTPNNLSFQKDIVARQLIRWSKSTLHTQQKLSGLFAYNNLHYEDYILNLNQDNKEYLYFLRYQGKWNFHKKLSLSYGNDIKNTSIKTENYTSKISEWGWDAHTALEYKPNLYYSLKGMIKVSTRSHLGWFAPFVFEANAYIGKNKNWKLWAKVGKDIKYATLNDRYWTPGGNENLLPEHNFSSNIGTSVRNHLGSNWTWNSSVEIFYNKVKDMILWMPTNRGYFQPVNSGEVLAYGASVQESFEFQKMHIFKPIFLTVFNEIQTTLKNAII